MHHYTSLATLRVALASSCLLSSVFCILPSLPLNAAIAPLAQDHVIVGNSPKPDTVPLYTPSIIALPNNRLVALYNQSGRDRTVTGTGTHILTSDDRGLTWQTRALIPSLGASRLLLANNIVYALGSTNPMRIAKSTDGGTTWSKPAEIAPGAWHQSATNFILANGNIYLAIEKRTARESRTWPVGELTPIVMRAKETDDLTNPKSWTFSQNFPFINIIPGYRENDIEMDYFGVPFFPQQFPNYFTAVPKRECAPIGWLEANIAQIKDPDHYWYDPNGKTFHIILRVHTGGTGYACLVKTVENPDGTLTTSLEKVPSGKTQLFLPMPGGHMRFHISYDEKTKLYWLLGTQPTDSMTRTELLPPDRYNLPNNERDRLVLHYSKNLVDWCFAGLVAIGDSQKQARHYASMDIDGDDLVILSRSGNEHAKDAHDGNIITFHRVKNFRDLVY